MINYFLNLQMELIQTDSKLDVLNFLYSYIIYVEVVDAFKQ